MSLKKYYENVIRLTSMPEFEDLSYDDVRELDRSLGFASWNASKAGESLRKALLKLLPDGTL